MKNLNQILLGACAMMMVTAFPMNSLAQSLSPSTKWEWNKGTIVVESPKQAPGQQSAIGLTLPKMQVVRVGFVGLGMRGPGAVERFTHIQGTEIVALCDYEQKRAENCQKFLQNATNA